MFKQALSLKDLAEARSQDRQRERTEARLGLSRGYDGCLPPAPDKPICPSGGLDVFHER